MAFTLDPRLQADTLALGRLPLSRVLLMNDRQYPWLILVPERDAVSELYELAEADQQQLMREITAAATALAGLTRPTKVNVGALGNIVRQLHIHIIARFEGDPAWPGPVWGKVPPQAYAVEAAAERRGRLAAALAERELPFEALD
jgi:Diadenosine tetraphosphate (Ap4A) hydrolase and other HIT family hydrolases